MTDLNNSNITYWFVGATYNGTIDQTQRFIENGIWENGYDDKYCELVKSINIGDKIAIKSSYTRKFELPFDNRGLPVSVMAIKAIGVVKDNFKDGHTIKVEWKPINPYKEWYFYTNRYTIWKVIPGKLYADALIAFAFYEKQQDIDLFLNDPYWKKRFKNCCVDIYNFEWTQFYEEIADKILLYKDRRSDLIEKIYDISYKIKDSFSSPLDKFSDGSSGRLKDICPFTAIGIFNRKNTDDKRRAIATEFSKNIGVDKPIPETFEGIPTLTNQRTWFFEFEKDRGKNDIDILWNVFVKALDYSNKNNNETSSAFSLAYDEATKVSGIGKSNLTMGLYWIRPWNFPSLDSRSREYISKKLNIEIGKSGQNGNCTAQEYLLLRDNLLKQFKNDSFPVHSFPELALFASRNNEELIPEIDTQIDKQRDIYSIENILNDGCFIAREKLELILNRLETKKNLILQGPPGTGKTWLAKRLAFALIGERNKNKIKSIQFHPNLSYEDFIRGWRPTGDGKLALIDGPFMEMVENAKKDPTSKYVVVIEEINRGQPSQIFGEMLTLLEADKRKEDEALELSYKFYKDELVYIPNNLYVIGTMNIADRSLALVDFALRRRFSFVDLEPIFGDPWRNLIQSNFNIDPEIILEIEKRILFLNNEISNDSNLGPQYRIGHSYVIPQQTMIINDGKKWFRQIVETEIGPLLDEYWFDSIDKSQKAKQDLLKDF